MRFRRAIIRFFFVCLACAQGGRACACHTGLVVIPTADTVGAGAVCLEAQFDGSVRGAQVDTRLLNTQFGLGPRIEAGVDFDLSEDPPCPAFFNAKYVYPIRGKASAAALGTFDVGSGLRASPYVVITRTVRDFRIHTGGIRTDGNNRWLVGADAKAGERLTLMADYTAGQENSSSLGAYYQFTGSFGVLAGAEFRNDRSSSRFTIHLVMTRP